MHFELLLGSLGIKLDVPGHGQLRGVRRRLRQDVLPLVEERPEETAAAAATAFLARLGGGSGPLVTGDDHAAAGDVRPAQEQLEHVSRCQRGRCHYS